MGPFTHLLFARRIWSAKAHTMVPHGDGGGSLLPVLLAGSLAPDAGYYPGAQAELAELVHLVKPFTFGRTLNKFSRSPEEKAFAAGWISHLFLDWLGHMQVVDPAARGEYAVRPLAHKQVEWGLDLWNLSRPQGAWLWAPNIDFEPGLDLWQREAGDFYAGHVCRDLLAAACSAEMHTRGILIALWQRIGKLPRSLCFLPNLKGKLVGLTLGSGYAVWLALRRGDMDRRAVLRPRRPDRVSLERLHLVLDQAESAVIAALVQDEWPPNTLEREETDQVTDPAGARALAWLKKAGRAPCAQGGF